MTGETLTRGLLGRRRLRSGSGHHPPIATRRPEHEPAIDSVPDTAAPAPEPQPRPETRTETEWSAHRMASMLCMLTAVASEKPVETLDQGQAMQDVFAARLLDNPRGGPWTVNEQGRKLLSEWGLDSPVPVSVRKAEPESAETAAV